MRRPSVLLLSAFLLAAAPLVWWGSRANSEPPVALRIETVGPGEIAAALHPDGSGTAVRPDDLRRKFDPRTRESVLVSANRPAAIFVLATGVQYERDGRWWTETEEPRNEIWRLPPGAQREVCFERPAAGPWRAFVRYGTEMRGFALLGAQVREAWQTRSLRHWSGSAWGGGRFSGAFEAYGAERDDP